MTMGGTFHEIPRGASTGFIIAYPTKSRTIGVDAFLAMNSVFNYGELGQPLRRAAPRLACYFRAKRGTRRAVPLCSRAKAIADIYAYLRFRFSAVLNIERAWSCPTLRREDVLQLRRFHLDTLHSPLTGSVGRFLRSKSGRSVGFSGKGERRDWEVCERESSITIASTSCRWFRARSAPVARESELCKSES